MINFIGAILVTIATWWTPAPKYLVGDVTWYAPGVMEATCQYRADEAGVTYKEYMGDAIDGISLISPADIGKTVSLRKPGTLTWEGPFRVCDCAMRGDMYSIIVYRKEIAELGWRTASKWGMGPHDGGWKTRDVIMLIGEDPNLLSLSDWRYMRPIDYRDWFLDMYKEDVCHEWVPRVGGGWEWVICD